MLNFLFIMMLLLHKILLRYAIIRFVFVILLHIAWSSVVLSTQTYSQIYMFLASFDFMLPFITRFLASASMQRYFVPWIMFCIYSAHFSAFIRRNPRLIYLPRIRYLPYDLSDRPQNRKYIIVPLSTSPFSK